MKIEDSRDTNQILFQDADFGTVFKCDDADSDSLFLKLHPNLEYDALNLSTNRLANFRSGWIKPVNAKVVIE